MWLDTAAAAVAVWLCSGCGQVQSHDSAATDGLAVPTRVAACLRHERLKVQFDDRYQAIGSGYEGGLRVTERGSGDELVLSLYSSREQARRALPQIEAIVHRSADGGAVRRRNVVLSHTSRPARKLRDAVRRCATQS